MKDITLKVTKVRKDEEENSTTTSYDIYAGEENIGHVCVVTDYEDEDTRYAYIDSIVIHEQHRNQGYGTAVIREISSMYFGAVLAPDNEDAKRLYERIGEEFSEDPFCYCDQGFGVYLV